MTVLAPEQVATRSAGDMALKAASVIWFLAAAAGQGLFVLYIAAFFGASTLRGDFAAWNDKAQLVHGHVPGDDAGNFAFAVHVLLGAILTFGGVLQLIPQIRAHAIAVHRINGRIFLSTAVIVSGAGLFLNAWRGSGGFDPAAITTNAALIFLFAAGTFAFARAGRIDRHRRWALRTYLVVNGVWFLRIGAMGFGVANAMAGGPEDLSGKFFELWAWGSFLVPLAILELYFAVKERGSQRAKLAMAGALLVLTVAMTGGTAAAWAVIWSPYIPGIAG